MPGYDLTFSAPKSVSLLHALGNERLQYLVVSAHEVSTAPNGCCVHEDGGVSRGANRASLAAILRMEDAGTRTRDLRLAKAALFQLS